MSKLRVLWLSNKVQTSSDAGGTGSWLDATARSLAATGEVTLANIAGGHVCKMERRDCGMVQQWVIPPVRGSTGWDGLPPHQVVDCIKEAVEEFSPDIIQVWGTEEFWGLLTARGILRTPALLEMQGLKGAYAKVFFGDLGLRERLGCIWIKDIVKSSSLFYEHVHFEKWYAFEKEMIKAHAFVGTQSDWIDAWVKLINPCCCTFRNDLILREPFYRGIWDSPKSKSIFCSAAYPVPYKGLHVALRALGHLRSRFPEAQLRIAGRHQQSRLRQSGYVAWLNREVRRLNLVNHVVWLGPLTAEQIVSEMRSAGAMVIPTFIENCCTAMQEGMIVGVPLVATYAGGLPSLARDEESCLFFPPGDDVMCAHQLGRLLEDGQMSRRLSKEARRIALARNDRQAVLERQIQIYREVLRRDPQAAGTEEGPTTTLAKARGYSSPA